MITTVLSAAVDAMIADLIGLMKLLDFVVEGEDFGCSRGFGDRYLDVQIQAPRSQTCEVSPN